MKAQGDEAGAPTSAPDAHCAGAGASVAFAAPVRTRAPAPACRAIASEALFDGACELQISHRGSLYRLKQTALGKLILTK